MLCVCIVNQHADKRRFDKIQNIYDGRHPDEMHGIYTVCRAEQQAVRVQRHISENGVYGVNAYSANAVSREFLIGYVFVFGRLFPMCFHIIYNAFNH